MNLNLPKLTQFLYEQLHNSCFRLHDDGAQVNKAKKIAAGIWRMNSSKEPNESIEKFKSEWLSFRENSKSDRKTRIFRVYNIAPGELLGEIKWSGKICAYCFYPAAGCFFSVSDIADVQEFIGLLMQERETKKFVGERELK